MKEQGLKYTLKEILVIVLAWLFALAIIYLVYLKVKILIN